MLVWDISYAKSTQSLGIFFREHVCIWLKGQSYKTDYIGDLLNRIFFLLDD